MRSSAFRRTAAVLGAAMVLGGIAGAPPARADDTLRVDLDTHSVAGDLLAVLGTTVVANSTEGGLYSKTAAGSWRRTPLGTLAPESVLWVGGGKVVFLADHQVQVLDVADNTVKSHATDPEQLRAATPDFEIDLLGTSAADPQPNLKEYGAMGSQLPLAWPVLTPATAAGTVTSEVGRGWLGTDVWVAPTVHSDAKGVLATDLRYVPTDTGTPFATRVNGTVLYAAAVGADLRYVSLEAKTLRDCTVVAGALPKCRTVKSKVSGTPSVRTFSDALGVTIGSTSYVWRSAKLTKVSKLPSGSRGTFTAGGTDSAPVLTVRGAKNGFYKVATSGKASLLAPAVVKPVVVQSLALGDGWVAGTDSAGATRAWVRQLDVDRIGATKVLSTKAREVRAAGEHYAVNGRDGLWLYADGVRTAKLKPVTSLRGLSGPWALVQGASGWTLRTATKVVAAGTGMAVGQFGSLVAQVEGDQIVVRDYASGTGVVVGDPQPYEPDWGTLVAGGVWGDWVMAGYSSYDADTGETSYRTVVFDYRTSEQSARALSQPVLGDGVVAGRDDAGHPVVWDFRNSVTDTIDAQVVAGPVVDGSGRVAYATASELVVAPLDDDVDPGASAPRVLSAKVTSGSFRAYDGWRVPWRLAIEASAPLAAGELRISDAEGVVATVATKASADGVLAVEWDGRDEDGEPVEGGDLTWKLAVFGRGGVGVDDAGLLRTLDGSERFSGRIDVQNSKIPFPQAKPTINDRTPVVGQELVADPGRVPTDSSADVSYTWYRGKAAVGSAGTYVVAPTDLGQVLTVKVRVDAFYYLDVTSATSSATSKVAKGTITGGKVTLDATAPSVGDEVTATAAGWSTAPDRVDYRWYRVKGTKEKLVSGAVAATYTPTPADVGYRLRAEATARATGYKDVTARSSLSDAVVAAG